MIICSALIKLPPEFWRAFFSLLLAILFGALIGMEREISGKPAGLRTNILICMGAALFTLLSQIIAEDSGADPTRITSQIVSGVGFLGAGAILRDRGGVQGLTTAASIWLVASVGVACGSGYYFIAALASILAILSLLIFHPLSQFCRRRSSKCD
jgi:putative Mg2+ transporter-C (MgtC) family protein